MSRIEDSPTRRSTRLIGVGLRTLGRSVLRRLPGGDRVQKAADYWTAVGVDMAETLGELRGAAMKLGQLASQYSDILPPQLAEQLQRLQRSAEPIPYARVRAELTRQWGAAPETLLARIEPQALAAASIGQVHRAQLPDGTAVVLKLRYPGVSEAVDADLVQLRRLIGLSKLLPIDGPALDQLMEEVRARFRDETDYRRELAHLEHMREAARLPGLVYPQPYPSLCREGVLVLSEERGVPLETARRWPAAVRQQLGQSLARWMLHQLFVSGAVHADPHPGNFAFRETGEIVVYDFGCVKQVPAAIVAEVRQLLGAAGRRDWRAVHASLDRLGGLSNRADYADIEPLYQDLERLLLAPLTATDGCDFADPDFILRLRDSARAHLGLTFQFKPVPDLVFVLRALSGHYWLLRALGARIDLNALLAEQGLRLRP